MAASGPHGKCLLITGMRVQSMPCSAEEQAALEGWVPIGKSSEATAPGVEVPSQDVNHGIGGDDTFMYVKYADDSLGPETLVLSDVKVTKWDHDDSWHPYCPKAGHDLPLTGKCPCGWERAEGRSNVVPGGLTTRTKHGVPRVGVCVRYAPFKHAVSTVEKDIKGQYTIGCFDMFCLSFGPQDPAFPRGDADGWEMASEDIHMFGGGDYVYLLGHRPMPTRIHVNNFDYKFPASYAAPVETIFNVVNNNTTDCEQTVTVAETRTVEISEDWKFGTELKLGVEVECETKIPCLGGGAITYSTELTFSYEFGKTHSRTHEFQCTIPVTAPARKAVQCKWQCAKATLTNVPFSADCVFFFKGLTAHDKDAELEITVQGLYSGVAYGELSVKFETVGAENVSALLAATATAPNDLVTYELDKPADAATGALALYTPVHLRMEPHTHPAA